MLALDIGIKHLAYCTAEMGPDPNDPSDPQKKSPHIKHWALVNLTDLNNTEVKPTCVTCGKPAKAKAPSGLVCGRHIIKDTLIYDEATGEPIKKAPTIGQLQAFLKAKGLDPKRDKRPALMERVEAIATMPLVKKKSVMSFADNTTNLHDAIRAWITRDWAYLSDIKDVYIEHQPVLKNPVMKTVQLLIFASLRERYLAQQETQDSHGAAIAAIAVTAAISRHAVTAATAVTENPSHRAVTAATAATENTSRRAATAVTAATENPSRRAATAVTAATIHFVHAGKKVKGAEVGDAGYKDRKAGGEERCKSYLSKFTFGSDQHKWLQWWLTQSKKDDLADTLCMVLDSTA